MHFDYEAKYEAILDKYNLWFEVEEILETIDIKLPREIQFKNEMKINFALFEPNKYFKKRVIQFMNILNEQEMDDYIPYILEAKHLLSQLIISRGFRRYDMYKEYMELLTSNNIPFPMSDYYDEINKPIKSREEIEKIIANGSQSFAVQTLKLADELQNRLVHFPFFLDIQFYMEMIVAKLDNDITFISAKKGTVLITHSSIFNGLKEKIPNDEKTKKEIFDLIDSYDEAKEYLKDKAMPLQLNGYNSFMQDIISELSSQ
ncbi:hypothetical protein [Sulfurimonas marina]|uniref:Uncharacterized protein n=1 Tax=Sulfurimonas marina TaxID=2590551 RepID=A0A7M1AUG0_9BACT|nr:hypothetical protein [Sulfurimonas marina]QOP41057.1 hypothetical protein FJR03_04600 [Sulfurimonas marina]